MTDLTAFLTHASLEAGEEQASPHQSCVEMMTLHSAKGLEFPRVFMVGVEEGVFPSFRSFEEPGRLEEERRLAYVGITRAKQKLTFVMQKVVVFIRKKNAICLRDLSQNCHQSVFKKSVCAER